MSVADYLSHPFEDGILTAVGESLFKRVATALELSCDFAVGGLISRLLASIIAHKTVLYHQQSVTAFRLSSMVIGRCVPEIISRDLEFLGLLE